MGRWLRRFPLHHHVAVAEGAGSAVIEPMSREPGVGARAAPEDSPGLPHVDEPAASTAEVVIVIAGGAENLGPSVIERPLKET